MLLVPGSDPAPRDTIAAEIRAGLPFDAAAALDAGVLTRHDLASRHRRVLPGIYVRRGIVLDTPGRIHATRLWSAGRATLSGWSAAHLHGERSFSSSAQVEITVPRRSRLRPQRGIVVRHTDLPPEHILVVDGGPVTTPDRTALDVARRLRGTAVIGALDSMLAHTPATIDGIRSCCAQSGAVHGRGRVLDALDGADAGAQSPPETDLRLLLERHGYRGFESQVEIHDARGRRILTADLADRDLRVALEYDGEHHLRREQRDYDSAVVLRAASAGWLVMRLTRGLVDDPTLLLERLDAESRRRRPAG